MQHIHCSMHIQHTHAARSHHTHMYHIEEQANLRSQVGHEPIVLITAHSKVGIVGEVDHVCWSHVDRVPQGAVRATGTSQYAGGVAGDVRLELGVVGESSSICCIVLGLQFVIAMVGDQGNAAAQQQGVRSKCAMVEDRGVVLYKDRHVVLQGRSVKAVVLVQYIYITVCARKS